METEKIDISDRFRIVSNGIKFRLQKKVNNSFLWWKWQNWYFFGGYGCFNEWIDPNDSIKDVFIIDFDTIEEAKKIMNIEIEKEIAEINGWSEVK